MKNDEKEKIFFKVLVCDYDRYYIQAYSIKMDECGEWSEPYPITVNLSEYELPELKEPGFYTIMVVKKGDLNGCQIY